MTTAGRSRGRVSLLSLALLISVTAACSREAQQAAAPAEPTAIPLALEAVGYGQRGIDGGGAPLPPGYLFRLTGISADELSAVLDAHGTDAVVQRPDGRASAVAPDLLVIQPALRVEAGRHEVRVTLPDGRSAAASFEIPAVAFAVPESASDSLQLQLREGVEIAERFAERALGLRLTRPITVWAREGPTSQGFVAEGRQQQIRIRIEHAGWRNAGAAQRRTLVVHEYFHLIQEELSDAWYVPPGPAWLIEGSAEVFAYRAAAAEGFVPYERALDCWTNATLAPGVPAPEAIEQLPGLDAVRYRYTVGALAAHRLAELADLQALPAFFSEATKAGGWRAAFERVFGRDLEGFYQEFAQYRAELPTPATPVCRP